MAFRERSYQFVAPPALAERIELFKQSIGFATDSEATRHLILKGLDAAGVPLVKPATVDVNKLGLL